MNQYPTLNKWLTALGIALWLLAPAALESGRMDPPLADTLFTTEDSSR